VTEYALLKENYMLYQELLPSSIGMNLSYFTSYWNIETDKTVWKERQPSRGLQG